MTRYMLDTNMVSLIAKQHPHVLARLLETKPTQIYISNISLAEIYYGLAQKPEAVKLHRIVHTLLKNLNISIFDETASQHYGTFKAHLQAQGKNLTPLDVLIASHADGLNMILVSNDQAFFQIQGLKVEDWTQS